MRDHLYTLDVLRFCAAFAVMVFHLCFYNWASNDASVAIMFADAARFEALAPFTWFGWVGVEVFFVISGFVIANSAHGAAPITFLKGRVLRLYPAVWVCAVVSLAAWLLIAHLPLVDQVDDFVRTITLWISGPWIDGVYWSLAVEIVFYALVFWVLVARRIVSLAAIPWFLTALSVAHELFFGVLRDFTMSLLGERLFGWMEWRHELFLMHHGAFFAIGVWLWMLSRGSKNAVRFAGLSVAFGAGLVEIVNRAQAMPNEVAYAGAMPAWAPVLVWLIGVALVIAAALRPLWFKVSHPGAQRALKRIGLMTYPLFLVHSAAGAGLLRVLILNGVNAWAALALSIFAALAFAYFVSATAEVAIRRVLRALLDRAEGAAKSATPALGWLFAPGKDSVLR
ncbi:membrane protein [alpha proteobacterium U9-1i]|nr:membrane protein [alpha proteobacterium U9-1i]